ncbi:MAG: Xaa-Pro peptidase family protein [Limosilactobacillus sp.]|nr:Xaa-Pro peptidase family protein [Limosilactobacillus sp.]
MTRLARLRQKLTDNYLDALIIGNPDNIYYLTGIELTAGDGYLLVTDQLAVIITDERYRDYLAHFDSDAVMGVITRDYVGKLVELTTKLELSEVGFENTLTYREFEALDDRMEVGIVPADRIVEKMRRIKETSEIDLIRAAGKLHAEAFAAVCDWIRPGVTERQVANYLDQWMKSHGASGESFPTIVASGPHSAQPHATVSERVIEVGDVVTLDYGYFVNHYTADFTRTIVMGQPTAQQRTVYQLLQQARQAVLDQLTVGITGHDLDRAGRQVIEAAGLGENFNHGMGHGIGLSVHEFPASYAPGSKRLKMRHHEVLTIEPGIYLAGEFGMRLEDDVVLTHQGVEVLTPAPTELVSVCEPV